MATLQMQRNKQKTGNWSTMFPVEQVTEQQSSLFVKKLLAVAISNITYLRTIFPEHAFGDRCLEDLNLKILRDDSTCPGACQVIQWVKGCFDALEKKYLKMIEVALYRDGEDPTVIVESYTFKFSYNEDGIAIYRNGEKISGANNASDTRRATIKLLRTIVVLTQTLKPLPDDVMMTMKLLYYDDVTPSDYEPPGFQATKDEHFSFKDEPMSIKVGDVKTQFHEVKLRIQTESQQFVYDDEEMVRKEDNDMEMDSLGAASTSPNCEAAEPVQGAHTTPDEEEVSSSHLYPNGDTSQDECTIVKCPCGYDEDEGMMILCGLCDCWQHGACFGMTDESLVPDLHICDTCASKSSRQCTDPSLPGMDSPTLQSHCLWRRALMTVLDMGKILPHTLAKKMSVDLTVAQGLVHRLEKEGYVKPPPKGKSRSHYKSVLKDFIKQDGFQKYFLSVTAPLDTEENIHSGISSITQKTSSMSIEAPEHNKPEVVSEQVLKNHDLPSTKPSAPSKRARNLEHDISFEISDSQEPRRKRRKASIASKAIVV